MTFGIDDDIKSAVFKQIIEQKLKSISHQTEIFELVQKWIKKKSKLENFKVQFNPEATETKNFNKGNSTHYGQLGKKIENIN